MRAAIGAVLAALVVAGPAAAAPAALGTEAVARTALAQGRAGQDTRARQALDQLLAGQQADGLFPDSLPAGEEVAMRLTPATGQAGWALAEAAARLAKADPAYAARLRTAALRALGDRDAQAGAATDALASAALGLAALVVAKPDEATKATLAAAADQLLAGQAGNAATYPYYAHRPRPEAPPTERGPLVTPRPATVAALAAAGAALQRPELVRAAQLEADHFGVHALLSGGPGLGFDPAPVLNPNASEAAVTWVEGLVRLWRRTHDPRYAQTAGLWASWLAAGGRAGSDEALMARQLLRDVPPAAPWHTATPVAPLAAGPAWLPGKLAYLDPPPPASDPRAGIGRLAAIHALDAAVALASPITGAFVVSPVMASDMAGDLLMVTSGSTTWRAGLAGPVTAWARPASPGPLLALAAGSPIRLTTMAPAGAKLRFEGLLLQPAIAARAWRQGRQRLTIARNYTAAPRRFAPGGGWSTMIGPHESVLVLD